MGAAVAWGSFEVGVNSEDPAFREEGGSVNGGSATIGFGGGYRLRKRLRLE
jgi:hypothetical protein